MSKKLFFTTLGIAIGCLALGSVSGYFIGNAVYSKKYGEIVQDLSLNALEDNKEQLYSKYSVTKKDKYLETFTPVQLVNIGYIKDGMHEYSQQQTYGYVDAKGIKQYVRGASIKYKNSYFMESLSSSNMIKAAKRFYEENDVVKTYEGSLNSIDDSVIVPDIAWNKQIYSEKNIKEHEETWGRTPSRPLVYIISSKTVLESSSALKTSNGYTVTLDLNPLYSTLRYTRQMIAISGVSNPTFDSVKIEYQLDDDLNLVKCSIEEHYSVVKVIKADSVGYIDQYFFYDNEFAIPDLNSNLSYKKGEMR